MSLGKASPKVIPKQKDSPGGLLYWDGNEVRGYFNCFIIIKPKNVQWVEEGGDLIDMLPEELTPFSDFTTEEKHKALKAIFSR